MDIQWWINVSRIREGKHCHNCSIWRVEILTSFQKSKKTVKRWCAWHDRKVWGPFSLWNNQWRRWPTWTCYSCICYPQLEDHHPNVMFPHTELVLSENILTCIFLGARLGVWTNFVAIALTHITLLHSSCGDALRTVLTRPLYLPRWTAAQNCCCDRNTYTANVEEHFEGNCIPLEHLTCHERRTCWSCSAFCSIDSRGNKSFWITLSYSVRSFILLFPVWKL
jgi:hypothetical protein